MPPSLCSECVVEDVAAIVKEQDRKEVSVADPKGKEDNIVWKRVDIVHEPTDQGSQRTIATLVPWRSADEPYSTLCSHIKQEARSPYPSTTKVQVIAKLSLPNDPHLPAEAINYQTFPPHLFEHWNGFNPTWTDACGRSRTPVLWFLRTGEEHEVSKPDLALKELQHTC